VKSTKRRRLEINLHQISAHEQGLTEGVFAKLRKTLHKDTTMLNPKFLDEISAKIKEAVAQSPAKDLEKNLQATLQSVFSRLNLITREEFDVQQEVLLRTREKLTALEARVAAMEDKQNAVRDEG
jgi:BMFP domain-containing protein YqiC